MSDPASRIDRALHSASNAVDDYASQFLETLPLREADLAALNRALQDSPQGRGKLAALQQDYLRRWLAIINDNPRGHRDRRADRRFAAPEWSQLPWFGALRELYLLNADYVDQVIGLADLDAAVKRRLAFSSRQIVDALSPANSPATNPQAIARAFQSGGDTLAKGAQALAADLARGRIAMTDETAFKLGRNLAITPGDVVFENELIQLIQYRPATSRVRARPLLIVPPFINKFYILDLQPENSFARFCVEQGMNTFIISWRNIPPELGHLTWADYVQRGALEAIQVVRKITGARAINALGYCVGGTLLATALAIGAVRQQRPVKALTLLASMLDFSDTGDISAYVDETYVTQCEQRYADGGVVAGSQLANAFASLRANELIWYFVVNNYLLGKTPRAFDLLYWNTDSANLPGPLYAYYLRNMYLENRLRVPGALKIQGAGLDLGAIDLPTMVVAMREDHIVPWQSAYRSARLLGGNTEFVLGASGHVAGVINPPAAKQRSYWRRDDRALVDTPEQWASAATEVSGSWWAYWMSWLRTNAGKTLAAPANTGSQAYPPLEAAPGRYVHEGRNERA
jgi:polyhydroxyalkanoate synthase